MDSITDEYDDSGNHWGEYIYQKDSKYYAIAFCNGVFSPVRPKKRTEQDWYEIREVKPIKKWIEITEWESDF